MSRSPPRNILGAKSVSLTSVDISRCQRVADVLVDPLRFPSVVDWQREVIRAARRMLGADIGSFQVPQDGTLVLTSDDLGISTRRDYYEVIAPLNREWPIWRRQVQLGVTDRRSAWAEYLPRYLRSSYYNEFIVPHRLHDALMLSASVSRDATASGIASIWFHHESAATPPFGDRGLALLSLLMPAFRAGAVVLRRVSEQRLAVVSTLDMLDVPLALCSPDGAVVHMSPTLVRLLAADPEIELVIGVVRTCAASTGRRRSAKKAAALDIGARLHHGAARVVTTRCDRYRIAATLAPASLLGQGRLVLVSVESDGRTAAPTPPRASVLIERFGLTRREAEVTALLCDARSSVSDISLLIRISPHTVRRHSERIFLKLGVHSRAELVTRLCLLPTERIDPPRTGSG